MQPQGQIHRFFYDRRTRSWAFETHGDRPVTATIAHTEAVELAMRLEEVPILRRPAPRRASVPARAPSSLAAFLAAMRPQWAVRFWTP